MVDLNDVALFVHVVRAGSFAEASRRLAIPPNTASRRVQELERDLGVRLLRRSTRRLGLTDAGQTFFAHCAEQVDALARSARELKDGGQVASGRVRVAVTADFFTWFPIEAITEFLSSYPGVQLDFRLSDARADLLGENIDVAFRGALKIEPNLVARQIGQSGLSLVASPGYLEARGTPVALAALSGHDCIALPTKPSGEALWHLLGPEGAVEVMVAGRFSADSADARLRAAIGGLGIALLPTTLTARHVQAGRLVRVLPQYGHDEIGLYLVYLSRRQLPLAVSAFIDFAMAKILALGMVAPLPGRGAFAQNEPEEKESPLPARGSEEPSSRAPGRSSVRSAAGK